MRQAARTQNGVPIDPTKTELLRVALGNKLDFTPVEVEEHQAPLKPAAAVRYLGVWLDSTLKFKVHAQHVAKRGQRLANCMRRLNTLLRGRAPSSDLQRG